MLVGVGRDGHILWASRRFRELFADRYRGERPALSAVLALRTDGGSAVPLDLSAQHRPERFEGVVDTEQGPLYIEATQLPPDVHQHDRVFYVIRDLTATKRASELLERLRRDLDERAVEVEAHEGLLKFAMDDLQRVYEDLLRTQSQLMQADKLATIGLLSAGIAHEINNPLMAVQGFLSAVSAQIEEWKAVPSESLADTRQFLEQARQCAEAMAHIVRDIRMFSRTDKGERVTEDPNRILDSVVSIVFHRFRTKVQLRKEYQELGVIECNPQQLAQVFINLIVNAAQAIPDRGTITLRTRSDGTGVAVDVEDDSCGMTPEVQARLFEPFFTTKGAETGTGLGLGICRDIVRRHGGEIRVKSSPGQGTTFTVSLPKTRSAQ
ncbi:MAG: Adaptive-response sensory-kinase SasA [Candidatus Omnitrophica bacterium]|nr:Adaptive-response sensory-kinase SasA [Candidatus Omnitrophota bacterium]